MMSIEQTGTLPAIDILAAEREFVETWFDRREPDCLICSDPDAFAVLFIIDVSAVRQENDNLSKKY